MILKMYLLEDGDNVINKNLTNAVDIEIVLRKDFNIDAPDFIFRVDGLTPFEEYNYISIPDINRFYFIDRIEAIGRGLIRVSCSCDVLETFKDDILKSNAKFYRNLKQGDYQDITIEESLNYQSTILESDKGLSDGETLILTSVGA